MDAPLVELVENDETVGVSADGLEQAGEDALVTTSMRPGPHRVSWRIG